MKTAELLTVVRLFFVFILSVIAPFSGHCAAYTSLLSWTGWVGSPKVTEAWRDASGEISKLSFKGNNPPLLFTYDYKAADENGGTVSELENNQFYVILDSQPGDQFNFCFRTPPALSTGHFPSPPVFKKPVTGQAMPDIQNGKVRQVSSTPDTGRWQHEYSASWRLPAGHQSLVLAIEDNDIGWVIEPECSGIFSESAALPSSSGSNTSVNKKTSSVDIFYRNKQAEKNGSGHSDDKSRFSGPLAIPGAPVTADNGEPFTSSSGGGFGSGDDLDDLFKKRPGGGMGPLYSFEWMSELVNSVILVPGIDGRIVKKQIWDTRVVLKIKQGWNEQDIIISQELWDKIRAANLERSSGLFLALSRNPDNPEAVIDHYLSSKPAQPLQTEDYRRHAQQGFILSPEQLRSVSVFPGHVPIGIGHSGGIGQAGNQKGDLGPSSYAQSQRENGRQNQGSRRGSESDGSDGDDGSGGSPNSRLCENCNKPVLAFDKCKECLDRESSVLEQEPTGKQPGQDGEETEAVEQELSDDEQEPTEELSSEMEQDSEAPNEADPSAVHVFQWFKTLESDGRQRGDCFRINDYYNFPELYKLLTQSLESDKNTLSQFNSKWVRFLNGSLSLYHLISEVGELAKSRGIEDYDEVTRILKALAVDRDKFEKETALKEFRNELLNYLTSNNHLASDAPGKVFYSGLGQQEKAELIEFIYEIFSKTGFRLNNETFPSRFITIAMLNKLARDVYAKYGFGLPNLDYYGLPRIIMWGCGNCGQHSFITPYNRRFLGKFASEDFHLVGLTVAMNNSGYFQHAEDMFTAMVLIRSMHGQRLRDMFPAHVSFAEGVPSEQLELLENFSTKANEQLVKLLEAAEPEKKDKFIHSMFLIFGMVPGELSDELSDPQPVPVTQAADM
ncbi:hypothetical protein [Endozoicomonas sp. ISHI1]|uniref:hypothetical protein n=1 Tax=Endozoicomonas sp. ISHI1 TaxID=2825882 RepID=UPI002148F3AF|nr:hypothetical protein [Endozoicomonas sp. ISHI1]